MCVEFFRAAKDALCFACFSIAEIDCEAVAAAVHAEAVRGGVTGTNIEDAPVILIKHFENDADRLQVVREAMLHDRDLEDEEHFAVRVLGGSWTLRHRSVAADTSGFFARSADTRLCRTCTHYRRVGGPQLAVQSCTC